MPSEASAKEGQPLYYIYLIESLSAQGERYFGVTSDLKQRLQEHNAGKSSHTSKFRPWKLKTYIAFTDRAKAGAFERYLKSGSICDRPDSIHGGRRMVLVDHQISSLLGSWHERIRRKIPPGYDGITISRRI